jgi:two-component system, cell cycle sensor histidine kinase and response regulator CckA
MKSGRETVDAFAREILQLIIRLRPVLEGSSTSWPVGRGRLAASISRDLATAVEALDAAVEELYFQTESLESAHQALEIERRSYQELFEGGPDGYLVTDPDGMILRANRRAGELFGSNADDLVGEFLPSMIQADDRPSLQAAITGFEQRDWDAEWIGRAVTANGSQAFLALTTAVVRHADHSVYRVRWSLRDISRRPTPD